MRQLLSGSRRAALGALVACSGALAIAGVACGDDEASSGVSLQPDGGVSLDGAKSDSDLDNADATTTSDGGEDAAPDGGLAEGSTCKTLHASDPSLPSGMYTIDLDGTGTTFPPISVYCDMVFDGGGWTMIQSFTGADSPANLLVAGDSGVLVASPAPGKLGGLADWIVKELAMKSSQVHIRLSFASDAGADAGTWVTSRMPDAGASTRVLENLRHLDILTKGTDGGFEEWGGPYATQAKLSWVPLYGGGPGTCLNPVESTKYPSIYWACGNFTSMNLYAPQSLCRWTYSPNTGNEPMEVLVR